MTDVSGKRILLGVTGGIAAYKAAELTRLFVKAGADVQVVMTEAACRFITPATLQGLSGKPVFTDMWDARVPDSMGHIELSRDRDMIVIAPATAGLPREAGRTASATTCSPRCASRAAARSLVAPAMNVEMWQNAGHAAQRRAAARGRRRARSARSRATRPCGEVGMGRMLEPEEIFGEVAAAARAQSPRRASKVLVTAGPTYEPIDTVRGITNRAPERWAMRVAQAAPRRAPRSRWSSGQTALPTPPASSAST